MNNKTVFYKALHVSLPIFLAYFPLGIVLGLVVENEGYLWILGPIMSTLVFAGAVQFSAISFLDQGSGLLELLAACFFIAIRNSFYGQTFFQRFAQFNPWSRRYITFGLVDATYALLLSKSPVPPEKDEQYCLFLGFLVHFYWVAGTFLGALAGKAIPTIHGLEFVLTLLFSILAFEQYLSRRKLWPLAIGIGSWSIMQFIFPAYALLGSVLLSLSIYVMYYSRKA